MKIEKVIVAKGFGGDFRAFGGRFAVEGTQYPREVVANAASIAGLMLTTEATITEVPQEKKDMPQSGPPMGGMGGMGGMPGMY